METKTKSTEKILRTIADKLMDAQTEIDELTVQLALGKAEARDKFEEIKKEFREKVSEFRQYLAHAHGVSEIGSVKAKAEELEKALAQGEVNTKEDFEEQKKGLLRATASLEETLEKKVPAKEELQHFTHDIEKFKLKLEILRLRFTLKKMEVKAEFKTRMETAQRYIHDVRESIVDRVTQGKEKYEDFRDEIRLAYKHFKKAIEEL